MESRVKSHISNKTYSSQLEKIEEEDMDAKTECYRLPISGHDIMVAPGKSIMDNGIAYCYVYVIQQEKVTTKLGVYEKKTDTMPLFFDLSTFPEGAFCLFEEFEKNPSRLIDLAMSEVSEGVNIFDYLIEDLYPKIENPKGRLKTAYRSLYDLYVSVKKTNEKEAKQMAPILKTIKEATDKDQFLRLLKEKATDKKTFVLTLLALQHIFLVHFHFISDVDKYQELLELWPIQDTTVTIEVDLNTYEKVEKAVEVNLNLENTETKAETKDDIEKEEFKKEEEDSEIPIDTDATDTALNGPVETEPEEAEPEEAETKVESEEFDMDADPDIQESESMSLNDETPKGTSLNTILTTSKSQSKHATKPKSKTASKPESKSETKSVLKVGSPLGTSLNAIPDKESDTKPRQETIAEETSLNLEKEATPKTKRTPKAKSETEETVPKSRKTTPKSKSESDTETKSETVPKSRKTTPKSKTSEEASKPKMKTARGISKLKSANNSK